MRKTWERGSARCEPGQSWTNPGLKAVSSQLQRASRSRAQAAVHTCATHQCSPDSRPQCLCRKTLLTVGSRLTETLNHLDPQPRPFVLKQNHRYGLPRAWAFQAQTSAAAPPPPRAPGAHTGRVTHGCTQTLSTASLISLPQPSLCTRQPSSYTLHPAKPAVATCNAPFASTCSRAISLACDSLVLH